jgi:hypothetical protein
MRNSIFKKKKSTEQPAIGMAFREKETDFEVVIVGAGM